jgi:hypothetical protein
MTYNSNAATSLSSRWPHIHITKRLRSSPLYLLHNHKWHTVALHCLCILSYYYNYDYTHNRLMGETKSTAINLDHPSLQWQLERCKNTNGLFSSWRWQFLRFLMTPIMLNVIIIRLFPSCVQCQPSRPVYNQCFFILTVCRQSHLFPFSSLHQKIKTIFSFLVSHHIDIICTCSA